MMAEDVETRSHATGETVPTEPQSIDRRRVRIVAPVVAVIEVEATTLPIRCEADPRVAELPICQKTLRAWAPFRTMTELLDAVTTMDAA